MRMLTNLILVMSTTIGRGYSKDESPRINTDSNSVTPARLPQVEGSVFQMDAKRSVEIVGPILMEGFEIADSIYKLANAPLAKGATQQAPITILVNSPGGMLMSGYAIVDAINQAKRQGVTVKCATGVLAASMAFNILASCSEVYALKHASLLFHPPRIMTDKPLTRGELAKAAEDLERTEKATVGELVDFTGLSVEQFEYHFRAETMWTAEQLLPEMGNGRIQLVDSIIGSQYVYMFEKPNPLAALLRKLMGGFRKSKSYEVIYISDFGSKLFTAGDEQ